MQCPRDTGSKNDNRHQIRCHTAPDDPIGTGQESSLREESKREAVKVRAFFDVSRELNYIHDGNEKR